MKGLLPAEASDFHPFQVLKQNQRRVRHVTLLVVYVLVFGSLWKYFLLSWIQNRSTPAWSDAYEKTNTACDKVPEAALEDLQSVERMSLHTFIDGERLEAQKNLEAPQTVCILAAVPQKLPAGGVFRDAPVPGKGPDTIHLLMRSPSVTITFPPLRPISGQLGLGEELASRAIVYYAEASLVQGGHYELTAEREWANWAWAGQWHEDPRRGKIVYDTGLRERTPKSDKKIEERRRRPDPEPFSADDMFPPTLYIEGPSTMPARPVCDDTISAARGRWYKASDHPNNHIDEGLVDDWGYTWEGDHCRTDFYSDMDEFDCLADKVVHLYGASNGRREAKAILSGMSWCQAYNDSCQSNDIGVPVEMARVTEQSEIVQEQMQPNEDTKFHMDEYYPFGFGKGSRLYFIPLRSVSLMPHDWLRMLYKRSDFTYSKAAIKVADEFPNSFPEPLGDPSSVVRPGAVARQPAGLAKADLVVVTMGGWDESADYSFADYARALPAFRDALLEAYAGVPIVMRVSSGFCCRQNFSDLPWRRLSGTRVQHMQDIFRDTFEIDGNRGLGGRIAVWDPSWMYGRTEVVRKNQHASNHPRAAHLRVENQMMLNTICARDPRTGRPRLRPVSV